jgi:hypothetical protein
MVVVLMMRAGDRCGNVLQDCTLGGTIFVQGLVSHATEAGFAAGIRGRCLAIGPDDNCKTGRENGQDRQDENQKPGPFGFFPWCSSCQSRQSFFLQLLSVHRCSVRDP